MNHDELLAKVDEQIAIWSSGEYGWPRQWLSDEVKSKTPMASYFKALRAVMELHKPWTYDGKVVCAECCNYGADREPPCPTIQAIEKELK